MMQKQSPEPLRYYFKAMCPLWRMPFEKDRCEFETSAFVTPEEAEAAMRGHLVCHAATTVYLVRR